MTPEDREQMKLLCNKIQEEQDSEKFLALLRELTDLLDRESSVPAEPRRKAS
jgi:hypothetical protein